MKTEYQHYFEANRQAWNQRTAVHEHSDFYRLESWKKGGTSLQSVELQEVGDVGGKKLLHLQCHFGQDTLSWARLGADVCGCDLSDQSIALARQLAAELSIPAHFVCCNLYDLPQQLDDRFDIVFSSYGTIGWLPELQPWARMIADFLKPGGFFYLAEFHPVVWMLDEEFSFLKYPYHNAGVIATENEGTYTDRSAAIKYTDYAWNHSLAEVICSLIDAGLEIEFLHEFPFSPYDCFVKTVRGEDGNFRIQGLENIIPMMYSVKAVKR